MKNRLYFAYGSNMDRLQMADRCPDSTLVSPAILTDYRYKIDASGFATILAETGANVWGLIWYLPVRPPLTNMKAWTKGYTEKR